MVVDLRIDGDRARERDLDAPSLGGVEHVDGAPDVDRRPDDRIALDHRNQQCGEVDDVRDPVLVEHPLERFAIGDVALHEVTAHLGREPEPPVVG